MPEKDETDVSCILEYWEVVRYEMHAAFDIFGYYSKAGIEDLVDNIYDELDTIEDLLKTCCKRSHRRKKQRAQLISDE